jgi:hypothetical protein
VTALIAGSILLIGAATACLAFGWMGENEALIWGSIAASAGSGVCLALAYYRSRAAASAPPPRPLPDPVRVRPAPPAPPEPQATALFDPDSGMGTSDKPESS